MEKGAGHGTDLYLDEDWQMTASDRRHSLSSSLSKRLETVRHNLKRAEDQLISWRAECTSDKRKSSPHRSKSVEDTRSLRLKYESHIHGLEDNLKRSEEKAQNERNAYAKCLVLAEQQLVELRQRFDNDRQHLCRRLTQLDDEVQKIESILNNQLKAENQDQQVDSRIFTDQRVDHELTTSASSGDSRDREELQYWKDTAKRLGQELHRERFEMLRKIKTLRENVSNLKLLRHHSQLDENLRETENFALQNERDALTIALYKVKIQQMASKLELEKAHGDLSDVLQHIRMTEIDYQKKRLLLKMTFQVLKHLDKIRDDISGCGRLTDTSPELQRSTKSLLSSLKDISVAKSSSGNILSKSMFFEPVLRRNNMLGPGNSRSPMRASSRPASPVFDRPSRSANAENRRKLTVSWGGCIVLDDHELTVRPLEPPVGPCDRRSM